MTCARLSHGRGSGGGRAHAAHPPTLWASTADGCLRAFDPGQEAVVSLATQVWGDL